MTSHLIRYPAALPTALTLATLFAAPAAAQGNLEIWGLNENTTFEPYSTVAATPEGDDFLQVACHQEHGVAVRTDGTLVSWGPSYLVGVLINTPTGAMFKRVSAGWKYSIALQTDGSINAW